MEVSGGIGELRLPLELGSMMKPEFIGRSEVPASGWPAVPTSGWPVDCCTVSILANGGKLSLRARIKELVSGSPPDSITSTLEPVF